MAPSNPLRAVALHDHLVVPLNGKEIRIPADPPELLPLLAESGNFGVSLVGEPEPDVRLEGVVMPRMRPGRRDLAPGPGRARRRSTAIIAGPTSNCRSRPSPDLPVSRRAGG